MARAELIKLAQTLTAAINDEQKVNHTLNP